MNGSMKKHIFLSFLLIALFLSCTKQEQENPVLIRFDYPVFYASFESSDGPSTRTYADPMHRIRWNKGDRVSIFNGNTTNLEYMFEGETGDSTGTFRFVDGGNKSAVQTRSVSYKYAVYPYDENCELSGDETLTVMFPAEQSYVDNSFGPKDNTMISISEDDTLFFRNAGGYLILKLYGDTTQVTSITLKGNKNEPICGKGYVTVSSDGIPSTRMSEEAGSTLTLKCEDPIPLDASSNKYKEFWFVVPPVTFTDGFTIVIEDSEGRRMTKSTAREVTVTRNERFRMTPLNVPALPATQFVKFEDENFKAYCVKNFDTNWDGGIDMDEALKVSSISLPKSPKIYSLAGIEYFVNLSRLSCESHQLTILDISNNSNLASLACSSNQLTILDISHNPDLVYLRCSSNQLTELDITHNPSLSDFNCSGNQLTELDVRESLSLQRLDCSNNQLTSLDISNNTSLRNLYCGSNQLTSLDVSSNLDLEQLNCSSNQLTGLDISHNKRLSDLGCSHNQLTSLDLGRFSICCGLDCSDNQLTDLNVTGCLCLSNLICDNNLLMDLDLSKCSVAYFSGGGNPIHQIKTRSETYPDEYPHWNGMYGRYSDTTEVVFIPEAVDLGLSVNWGSLNLWAQCPEDEGAYYAWGELVPLGDYDPYNDNLYIDSKWYSYFKRSFDWTTYKWCDRQSEGPDGVHLLTKYCYDSQYGMDGFTDDLFTLEEDDDAASFLLGDGWRIPTADEWNELKWNCSWETVELNGVPVIRATSKIPGYTDRSVIFPLAGQIMFDQFGYDGRGYYWSSSMKYPSTFPEAFSNDFNPGMACASVLYNSADPEPRERILGLPIRPVKPNN
jgi:hypothetical protein